MDGERAAITPSITNYEHHSFAILEILQGNQWPALFAKIMVVRRSEKAVVHVGPNLAMRHIILTV